MSRFYKNVRFHYLKVYYRVLVEENLLVYIAQK